MQPLSPPQELNFAGCWPQKSKAKLLFTATQTVSVEQPVLPSNKPRKGSDQQLLSPPCLDGLVVLVPGLGLPYQALVDLLEAVSENGELLSKASVQLHPLWAATNCWLSCAARRSSSTPVLLDLCFVL